MSLIKSPEPGSARCLNQTGLKDTVDDPAPLDVPPLAEVQLDKLPKAAGVVVVDRLGVAKGLHDGAAEGRSSAAVSRCRAGTAQTEPSE